MITGKGEPGEGDCLTEQIIGTTEHDLHQTVQTRLEAFATMVYGIHNVLLEHQTMPDYLRDTLCALIKAVQDTSDMTVRAQKFVLQDVALKDYIRAIWANTESERLSGSEVKLYQTDTANKVEVSIVLRKNEQDTWVLGVQYHERREYELHSTGYLYRVDGRQIFTDPVGSHGNEANIADGLYLPSRLKLPKSPTSVTV